MSDGYLQGILQKQLTASQGLRSMQARRKSSQYVTLPPFLKRSPVNDENRLQNFGLPCRPGVRTDFALGYR
jgi:hypothetical protein